MAHKYLGLTYESLDRRQEAMVAYKRAVNLKSDYAEAHYNLGLLYLTLGNRNQAQEEYDSLISLKSDLAAALASKMRQSNPS